jgi:ABC-type branched-subunit amino acid transport system substrate-binding protein
LSIALLITVLLVAGACTARTEETTTSSAPATSTTTTTTRPAVLTGTGVSEGTIRLGAFLPLSGTLEVFGRSALEGHEVYWAYANDTLGGVGGDYHVEVIPLDTAYVEDTARSLWAANEGEILAVSSVLGSPITAALIEEIGDQTVLVAAGSQASSWSNSPHVVLDLTMPAYRDQIAGAVVAGGAEERIVAVVPPLALLYQEGVFGEDCLTGFEQATARLPSGDVVVVSHTAGATDFGDDLSLLQSSGVETVFVCTSSQAFLRIVATLDLLAYVPTVIASSQSYNASMPAALGGDDAAGLALLANVYLVGSLPPFESDAPGMKLLRDNLAAYDSRLPAEVVDPWFLMGYTQAATFHLILEEALFGGDLTRAGMWAARDRLGEVDFGFGAGPVRYDENRVPVVADRVSVAAASSEALFGMVPIGEYYSTR